MLTYNDTTGPGFLYGKPNHGHDQVCLLSTESSCTHLLLLRWEVPDDIGSCTGSLKDRLLQCSLCGATHEGDSKAAASANTIASLVS